MPRHRKTPRRVMMLPAKCCLCGRETKAAPFVGDFEHAIVAETACCYCQGKLYRNDRDNLDRDIGRSAWEE